MSDTSPCFGISLGASASLCCDSAGEIYRNELGGHTTATYVAFTGEGFKCAADVERDTGGQYDSKLHKQAQHHVRPLTQVDPIRQPFCIQQGLLASLHRIHLVRAY